MNWSFFSLSDKSLGIEWNKVRQNHLPSLAVFLFNQMDLLDKNKVPNIIYIRTLAVIIPNYFIMYLIPSPTKTNEVLHHHIFPLEFLFRCILSSWFSTPVQNFPTPEKVNLFGTAVSQSHIGVPAWEPLHAALKKEWSLDYLKQYNSSFLSKPNDHTDIEFLSASFQSSARHACLPCQLIMNII